MAFLISLFFVMVLVTAIWTIVATVAPRASYILDLLSDSATAPVLAPVAQRRRVRRISPLALRPELPLRRAAA